MPNPSDIEKQILEQTNRWNDASLRTDLKVIDLLYSDDCIFHFPNGQSENKTWVMNLLSSGNVKFESIDNENVRIRVYGDAVLWTSRTSLIETYNNQRSSGQYLWLRLWTRERDRWRIVAFQSTPIPSPS
jgi:ketosteroid isomerase-like protein